MMSLAKYMPNNAPITKLGQQLGIHAAQGTQHGPPWTTKCVSRDIYRSPMPAHCSQTWPATHVDEVDHQTPDLHCSLALALRQALPHATLPVQEEYHSSEQKSVWQCKLRNVIGDNCALLCCPCTGTRNKSSWKFFLLYIHHTAHPHHLWSARASPKPTFFFTSS